jgi:hypothetical protein
MRAYPQVKIGRFNTLEPGDLFTAETDGISFFGLKCAKNREGDPNEFVALGPAFPYPAHESSLVPWDEFTAVSYGKDFSVILPTAPGAWSESTNRRKPVCLGLCQDELYICAIGGHMKSSCFVHIKSGKVLENRLPSYALYTHDWQIAVPGHADSLLPLLRFPLPSR